MLETGRRADLGSKLPFLQEAGRFVGWGRSVRNHC